MSSENTQRSIKLYKMLLLMKPDKKRKGNTFKRVLENHKQVKQMQTQFLQNYYDLALLSEM